MNAKGIIFDFNGTLLFDYEENKVAWNEISLIYRGKDLSETDLNAMMGQTDRSCAKYIVKTEDIELLDKISEEKEDIYKRLCVERKLDLEPYAIRFMEECKKRGLRLMIASSAPKGNMDFYIQNLHLEKYFAVEDIVAGRNDIKSKPAPDIYLYTQKLGGLKGSECLCFEDAPAGLKSANGAGFAKVFGIKSPGMDWKETGKLAPLYDWQEIYENIDSILTL